MKDHSRHHETGQNMSHQQADPSRDKSRKDVAAEWFDGRTNFWKRVYHGTDQDINLYYRHFMSKRKDTVIRMVEGFAEGRALHLLDIGCGAGVILSEFVRRGHTAIGLDYSREMTREAYGAANRDPARKCVCVQADVEALPFRSDSFDAVTCVGVLQYLRDDRRSIEEISRILRPQGIAIITLPNILRIGSLLDPFYYIRALEFLLFRLSKKIINRPRVVDPTDFSTNQWFSNRRYRHGQLGRMFRELRLKPIETASIGFGPLTFWRRNIFTHPFTLSLSDFVDEASRRRGLRWLNYFANRWVLCVRKAG
jgi:ubiquinone/menaquinone biosynthesis C-methylase UbiE